MNDFFCSNVIKIKKRFQRKIFPNFLNITKMFLFIKSIIFSRNRFLNPINPFICIFCVLHFNISNRK
ncbi:hypothetical protein GLOIN_2v1512788, partial [Rhizophagus irregularis DAOM 181602=DAOM 197198]